MNRLPLALAALLLSSAALAAPATYTLDPGHSQVRLGYSHFGFSNIELDFRRFDARLLLDTEDFTQSSVEATVDLASVDSGVAKLDEHLVGKDFFDVAQYPKATFKSRSVERVDADSLKVQGDLTIHGVTKPVVMDVQVNKVGEHPMTKKPTAGFDATLRFKRSDFGVGLYAPNVSDEVVVEITTETNKAG